MLSRSVAVGKIVFSIGLCALLGAMLPQARASVDISIFSQYRSLKTELVNKERSLQQDMDSLQRQIDDLSKRRNQDFSGQINDLSRSFDERLHDLREIRHEIRDLDMRML